MDRERRSHDLRTPQGIKAYCVSKLREEDYHHRGFLKPIEIALKTHKTESGIGQDVLQMATGKKKFNKEEAGGLKAGSLPAGLKIAVKNSILNNKFVLQNVEPIHEQDNYQKVKETNKDNMLSLMKRKLGIELAICVCMYSEDKKMLRSTLKGIQENISNLTCYEGISPDKIGVFVMMDGIEKVEDTVVDFFEQMERSNNIQLGTNIAPTLSIEEMSRRARTMTPQEINQMELQNVNNFLFDVEELKQRNDRRFFEVRKQYLQVKGLMNKIAKMERQKPLFDDLPSKLRDIFIEVARNQYMSDLNLGPEDEQIKKLTSDRLIEEYANDLNKVRPLIIKTLQEGKRYCKQYIRSREDLAYLVSYRQKIKHDRKKLNLDPNADGRNEGYTEAEQKFVEEEQVIEDQRAYTYMNLFLCVKYRNSGKLSSHNWFFNGFCKQLRPNYAILLDVGLKPADQALWKMYKYMKKNQRKEGDISGGVGGVCGYMSLKIERVEDHQQVKNEDVDCLSGCMLHFADIQRTQQVQYHFAHLMDKPFQSIFGFIHVLPGAFSAYNMKAILDYDRDDDKLLKSYFKSIEEKLQNNKVINTTMTIPSVLLRTLLPDSVNSCCLDIDPQSDQQMLYNENIYLAQDRILCMGIHKKGFDMAFLPDAYAEVDPIKTVHGLLGQRKRWINGSFFAFQKVKKELKEHEESTKNTECMLHVQIFYLTLMNTLAYISPALFAFTVHVAMEAFRADLLVELLKNFAGQNPNAEVYRGFVYTMDWIYVMFVLTMIFLSIHLTNSNARYKPYIYAISTLFGLFGIMVFLVLTIDVIRGLVDSEQFLTRNEGLITDIPGGLAVVDTMRWLLIGVVLSYGVPIMAYLMLFGNFNILLEVIAGAFSFLFYAPTYLNILNIYSLCRIDDISWGTKGLDSGGSTKNKDLKDSWRLIKMVHVAKYVFWNIVFGVILLSFGSSYVPRFYITFGIVILMAFSIGIKILVAVLYLMGYKLFNVNCCADNPRAQLDQNSRMKILLDRYQPEIQKEVEENLNDMEREYKNKGFVKAGGSFIMAGRTKNNAEKSYKKKEELHSQQSKIVKKQPKPSALTPIKEENGGKRPSANQLPPLEKRQPHAMSPIHNEHQSRPKIEYESPLREQQSMHGLNRLDSERKSEEKFFHEEPKKKKQFKKGSKL